MNLGSYRPHSFFARAKAIADLNPGPDGPFDCAVPAHVHEYVHLLHNVSTASGLNHFRANLWLVRLLRDCTDAEGRVVRKEPVQISLQGWLSAAAEWSEVLYGGATWDKSKAPEKVAAWTFKEVRKDTWRLGLAGIDHTVDHVAIEVEAQTHEGIVNGRLNVGYDFISEGVAYEVEREVFCASGKEASILDRTVPAYPYLAFQPLLEHLIGRPTTALERIQLGVLSLMSTSPADALFGLSECLRQYQSPASTSEGVPAHIVASVVERLDADPLAPLSTALEPELDAIFLGDIAEAAREVRALFRAGLALRSINPFLESIFVGVRLDREGFLARIGTLLVDYCMLQEKPDGNAELSWIGPGIVGADPQSRERLAVLQAAIHYATRHRHQGKFLLTAELPTASCPFGGACTVEQQDGRPADCQERPWDRFRGIPKGQPKCWYAAAVDLFRAPNE